jgi:thiamine pyrophosphate-dependent acetolactate synthase large subunit-like protein
MTSTARMKKLEALPIVLAALKDRLVVVCNGMIGREVFSVADRPEHFYMIGSMGIAPAIALGLAHCRPDRKIAVIEGDGNTLMGMGNLAQIAADQPKNLIHICLDNGAHASTGNQTTISPKIPLEKVALAAGYRRAMRAESIDELERAMKELVGTEGPVFLLATVEPGTVPGIARIDIDPPKLTERMRASAKGA